MALEAELDAAQTRLTAEQQAAESGRSSFARERAVADEQRRGVMEQLRQLQAREEALAQVNTTYVIEGDLQPPWVLSGNRVQW